MGSFNRKSEFRKGENIDKPISPNEKFHVASDTPLSLLTEFRRIAAEADSLPTDANKLLSNYGIVGCHSNKSNDLPVHARINSSGYIRNFFGNQMLMTHADMPQSLKANLARRQKEQSGNRASDLLRNSSLIWNLLRSLWKAATSVHLRNT